MGAVMWNIVEPCLMAALWAAVGFLGAYAMLSG